MGGLGGGGSAVTAGGAEGAEGAHGVGRWRPLCVVSALRALIFNSDSAVCATMAAVCAESAVRAQSPVSSQG